MRRTDEETRKFWAHVDRNHYNVLSWPEWKYCGGTGHGFSKSERKIRDKYKAMATAVVDTIDLPDMGEGPATLLGQFIMDELIFRNQDER